MLRRRLLVLRRKILQSVVPEFVWPRFVDVDGVQIPLRHKPYSFGVKRLLWRGGYELPERKMIGRILKPGMSVVELGGSIGVLTSVISHRIGTTGRLVSVEASADLVRQAADLLQSCSQTTIVHGFGFPVESLDSGVSITGFVEDQGSLGGFVRFGHERAATSGKMTDLLWDLNRLRKVFTITPEVLVCDIEGSEVVLLDKSPAWPTTIRDVVIEIHPQFLPNGDADQERIVERIRTEGFELQERESQTFWFRRRLTSCD
jgi:hypothetical protein